MNPAKHQSNLLLFLLLTVIIIATHYIYITMKYPYIGLSVSSADGQVSVSEVYPLGWAQSEGIHVGDIVISVNHQDPLSHFTVRKYGGIEQAEHIEISRNGKRREYSIPTHHWIMPQLIYHTFVPSLFFIICIGLCIFLFEQKRRDKTSFLLILFLLAVGLSYMSAGASARGDALAKLMVLLSFSFIPVLFLHFIYTYFRAFSIKLFDFRWIYPFYWINGLLIVIQAVLMIRESSFLYHFIRLSQLIVFSASILVCLYIMVSRYMFYRNTIYKPILKILGFGIILAFLPFLSFFALPRIFFGTELLPGPLAGLFLIILPLTFLYLILANRLLDIDFILDRIRYYSLLAVFPSILAMGAVWMLSKQQISSPSLLKLSLLIFAVNLGFLYLKEKLDYQFRSKLFKEKYNFQASLDRFSENLSTVLKVSELEERLISEVKEVLQVKEARVLEIHKDGGVAEKEHILEFLHKWMHCPSSNYEIGDLIDLNKDGVCMLVGEKTDKLYFLWLGEKMNRTQFNRDEKIWLKTIAHYVSIVYKNLHLIEGLVEELEAAVRKQNSNAPWVSRLLFNLTEKERRLLASELHDSALQEQLLWYRKLETVVNDKNTAEHTREQLEEIKEGLLDVIYQIRDTCNELRPPFLKEMGIVEALENLFEYTRLRTDYVIHFQAMDFAGTLDDEQALALYRIVQELLSNAAKHSKATEVNIGLRSHNNGMELLYRDNGIGMNIAELKSSFQNMGLSGMKERVLSLEGTIDFRSKPNEGFEVRIWFPVTHAKGETKRVI